MRNSNLFATLCLATVASLPVAVAQSPESVLSHPTPLAATSATVVPMLVRYDGMSTASSKGAASMTFLIFKDQTGGEPLWIETQNVAADATGKYEVYLGSSYSSGLPTDLFGTGEARWLEVQIAGETPGPRTLLTSVPYALKAADAATLGGLPASAFMLASPLGATTAISSNAITPDAASTVTTTGGTNLYVPRFSGAATIVNSEIYDTGTSVGIGDTPNASAKLDVNGAMIMRGNMQVTRTGNATTAKGAPSYGFQFYSNVYNSSTKATDNPYFQLQSEPSGNNTASPTATFNLLFSNNGSAPAETGFYISPNGTIHFASGQAFPGTGTGNGTITGVTAGTGLTGGGTSGNVTLNVNTATIPTLGGTNSFTGSNTFVPSIYENLDINIDNTNSNAGGISPGLRFGNASGEGVASQRASGTANQYGLDLMTNYTSRLAISATGEIVLGQLSDLSSVPATTLYLDDDNAQDADIFIASGSGGECAIDADGDLGCDGTVSGAAKDFKIDDPSDPANKYLVHASVESSEMMNIYSGNVTTDGSGTATVTLPDWFEAENGDFRYQLTTIGQDARAWISQEVSSKQFKISTNVTNVKVSWQITAVRQDAYAKAHPVVAEQEKTGKEKGFYQHPELFGQPKEKGLSWARTPKQSTANKAQVAKAKTL